MTLAATSPDGVTSTGRSLERTVPAATSVDITVIVPARNEAADLVKCLQALANQDLDHCEYEVLVVDGDSSDGTATLAADLLATFGLRGGVLANPDGSTPTSLNIGLAAARGRIVSRVDARSVVPRHYLRTCRARLDEDPNRSVVGGAQVPVDDRSGLVARSIARALGNQLTTGLARYRRGATSGPTDTVYLGSFRRDELRDAGGWNPRFRTNQDYELNRRMADRGVVWFEASLPVGYIPRSSLGALAVQYRRFGRWKAAIWLETDQRPTTRHQLLLAAPPLAATAGLAALRWRPRLTLVAVLGALVAIDRGAARPAPVPERIGGVVAALVSSACWWAGIVEQCARAVRGERLLDPLQPAEERHAR